VAPGHKTFSARSSGALEQTCEVAGMSGTSMATPATTGVAAQIRQYFEDSSYWETNCAASSSSFVQGSPLCSGGAFSPRGATVKALLVHSGEPMLQYNSPIPYCYGYGGDEPDEPDACATCNGN
jgi:subtilisin family serine protease